MGDTKNVFAHLTNYSINKRNLSRFVQPDGKLEDQEEPGMASKWSLNQFKKYVL